MSTAEMAMGQLPGQSAAIDPTLQGTAIEPIPHPSRVVADLTDCLRPSMSDFTVFSVLDTSLVARILGRLRLPASPPMPEVHLPVALDLMRSALPPTPSPTPISLEAGTVRTLVHFFPPTRLAAPSELEAFSFDRVVRYAKRYEIGSPHYKKFVSLADWLGLDHQEMAKALEIKRTTPYAWAQGVTPRRRTVRKLQQFYAFCSALVQRVGESDARDWLNSGDPTPRELLLEGNLSAAQRLARPLLFEHVREPRAGAWLPDADASTEEGIEEPQTAVEA